MNKILKVCYWLSVPVFMVVLMYAYAMLPVGETLFNTPFFQLTKEGVFYISLITFLLCNALVFIYQRMKLQGVNLGLVAFGEMTRSEKNVMWINGLVMFLNITFAFLLFYLGLYHSRDIDISLYAFLLYIGPILLAIWIFYWVILRFSK